MKEKPTPDHFTFHEVKESLDANLSRLKLSRKIVGISLATVLVALQLTSALRAQQPQTPNAGAVATAGINYTWVPYTNYFQQQWSAENLGTPTINHAPADTRIGDAGLMDANSASVIAGGDMFTVSIDEPGDALQPVQTACTGAGSAPGDVQFVSEDNPLGFYSNAGYQGVLLWRINPATGAVRNGYPKRLDAHEGVCYLPRIVVSVNGNLFVAWKETVPGSGDQIAVAFITVASDAVTGPEVRSGTFVDGIKELSLASSTDLAPNPENSAVLFRTGDNEIYADDLTNALVWDWGGVDLRIDDPAISSEKWNPIIKWNDVLGHYDMAWGDDDFLKTSTGPADIFVQAVPIAAGVPATLYATPQALSTLTVSLDAPVYQNGPGFPGPCEFYMEPCYGYNGGSGPDQGQTAFFYRDQNGNLALTSVVFGSGGPTIVATPHLYCSSCPVNLKGYPMSLTRRHVPSSSPTQEDLIAVYLTTSYSPNGIYASYVDMTGTIAYAQQVYTGGTVTGNPLYKSFAGVSDNFNMYLAVPTKNATSVGEVDLYGFSFGPFALKGGGGPLASFTTRDFLLDLPYFSGAVPFGAESHLCIFNFQYGLSMGPSGSPYQWTDQYMDHNNPETDERFRADYENATYDFTSYAIGGSYPYLTSPVNAGIQDNTVDIDPNTAALGNTAATVFSQSTSDGVSNLILGVTNGYTQTNISYTITSASGGDSYYEPKVALYPSGGVTYALVTYLHESGGGGSTIEDVTVNLSTGVTTADPLGPISSNLNHQAYRNWGIVYDPANGNCVCVFTDSVVFDASTYIDQLGTVEAVGYTGGTRAWGPSVVSNGPGGWSPRSTRDELRLCYNPDPSNTGAYVTWRETPNPSFPIYATPGYEAGIAVQAIGSSFGSLWPAPSYLTAPGTGSPNSRRNPCICAGPATATPLWVFVGWEDQNVSYTSPLPYRVFGGLLNNTGGLIPPSSIYQLSDGAACPSCSPEEAHHPDAIADPLDPNKIIVAYDRDALAPWTGNPGGGTNGIVDIELRKFDMTLTAVPGSTLDIANPSRPDIIPLPNICGGGAWPMDDALWSFYGTMQRRPKLIAINPDSSAFPHVAGTSPAKWVMCVFEAEAYDLYQQPATASGGTAPTYGLASPYLDMWKLEMNRGAGITGYSSSPMPDATAGYLQNNILATVVNPALNNTVGGVPASPVVAANLAVFANTNAQDLKCVAYTDDLGPIATCIDFTNSDNGNGIVRQTQVIPNYYSIPGEMGAPVGGAWPAPPLWAFTKAPVPSPEFFNTSYFPLVLHPAVGSPDPALVPPAPYRWFVDPATNPTMTPSITLEPEHPEPTPIMVDYYGNSGVTNALTVTAHAEQFPYSWPISLPDEWGNTGNTATGIGCGFKRAIEGASASSGELSVSITEDPAIADESARVAGLPGRTARIRVLNILGQTMQTTDGVTIGSDGTDVPIEMSSWPSGNYIIEAIGDEGSHARAMFSVQR